jgi:hypothetical protein
MPQAGTRIAFLNRGFQVSISPNEITSSLSQGSGNQRSTDQRRACPLLIYKLLIRGRDLVCLKTNHPQGMKVPIDHTRLGNDG